MRTYQGMNERIVAILRQHDNPAMLYAAARIEELERHLRGAQDDAQAQSEAVQRDWLSPAETEGLRRQLWNTEEVLAIACAALEWHATADPAGQAVDALAEIERRLSSEALKRIVATEQQLRKVQSEVIG